MTPVQLAVAVSVYLLALAYIGSMLAIVTAGG